MAKSFRYEADSKYNSEAEYEYDSHGNKIKETQIHFDYTNIQTYEYDDASRLIKETHINRDEIDYSVTYEYDSLGNNVRTNWFDSKGELSSWDIYEYDEFGNTIKEVGEGQETYQRKLANEYDDAGNLIKKTYLSLEDDWLEGWEEYTYDASGNQTKFVSYYPDGSVAMRWEYEYDASGNETKRISCLDNGEPSFWNESYYDAAGNKTGEALIRPSGKISDRSEYEYDASGKLLKVTKYDSNDRVYQVEEYMTIIPE